MGKKIKSPSPRSGGDGLGNFSKLGSPEVTLAHNSTQPHQVIFLQRRLHLPAKRAALIAELHFGGAA